MNPADEVEEALSVGEVAWALRCAAAAVQAARKAGGGRLLAALRRHASIELAHADDASRRSPGRSPPGAR